MIRLHARFFSLRFTSACAGLSLLLGLASTLSAELIQTWENQNIGTYTLTQPGVYQIKGTVTGNILVDPKAAGDITIVGVTPDATLHGIPRPGRRHESHYTGHFDHGTMTWKNLTLIGDGHNVMEFNGDGTKVYDHLHVKNYGRTENGHTYADVGSINGGTNSTIRDCVIETGDDAAKLTETNSRCYRTSIRLTHNGAAIQLGWKDRCDGPDHIAEDVKIRGQLEPNIKDQGNDSDNPGRCVIGGIMQNNASKILLTKLDIDVTNYKHLIKLIVQPSAKRGVANPTVENIIIQGTATERSIMNHGPIKCVSLVAQSGAHIRNAVIDLGDKIARPEYHYIAGDVDVKFIFAHGAKSVEYRGGKLVHDDTASPASTTH